MRGNMRMRLFFDGEDSRCLKLAERLVTETEAEIVHSNGMQPTLLLDGAIYYGLESIEQALREAGCGHVVPTLPSEGDPV